MNISHCVECMFTVLIKVFQRTCYSEDIGYIKENVIQPGNTLFLICNCGCWKNYLLTIPITKLKTPIQEYAYIHSNSDN